MFSQKDEIQIRERHSQQEEIKKQIENFKKGFPYLKVEEAATIGNGIIKTDHDEVMEYGEYYDQQVQDGIVSLKFVPASGAASRMFKALFEALENCRQNNEPEIALEKNASAREFVKNIEKFAFFRDLEKNLSSNGAEKNCLNWIDFLLNQIGRASWRERV